jgi:hypothetical protein
MDLDTSVDRESDVLAHLLAAVPGEAPAKLLGRPGPASSGIAGRIVGVRMNHRVDETVRERIPAEADTRLTDVSPRS